MMLMMMMMMMMLQIYHKDGYLGTHIIKISGTITIFHVTNGQMQLVLRAEVVEVFVEGDRVLYGCICGGGDYDDDDDDDDNDNNDNNDDNDDNGNDDDDNNDNDDNDDDDDDNDNDDNDNNDDNDDNDDDDDDYDNDDDDDDDDLARRPFQMSNISERSLGYSHHPPRQARVR